jgi:hypothetical protein
MLQKSYTPKRVKSGKMIVTVSTQDSIVRLATALVCVGEAIESQEARIQENAGLVEEVILLLHSIDTRLKTVEGYLGIDRWENEGGR